MECKKCSAVNPEEAVFCRNCGKRLDGKVSCPACDAMNDEDSNFCIHCGTKLSNKSICPSCNTVYEGNFCPACGKTAPAQPQTRAHKAKQTVTPPAACATSKWRKILEYVGGGLAMSAVFFAVLFAFLIGVNVGNISNLIGANGVNVTMEVTIFDFFGKAYEDLDFTYYDSSLAFVELFPTILGTLIVVVTLVCVVVFAALAIARYIKFVTGKSQKDYSTFAAATVISFLTGALAFLALNSVIGGASMSGVSATAATGFNSATIAGIVLASIFFAAFAGCRIAVHAKDIFTQKRMITVILSAVGVALLSIALHFAGEAIAIASIGTFNDERYARYHFYRRHLLPFRQVRSDRNSCVYRCGRPAGPACNACLRDRKIYHESDGQNRAEQFEICDRFRCVRRTASCARNYNLHLVRRRARSNERYDRLCATHRRAGVRRALAGRYHCAQGAA